MDTNTDTNPTIHVELPFNGSVEIIPSQRMTDAEFEIFCQENPELQVELEPDGTLLIMPPAHFDSGHFELEIASELRNYVKSRGKGLSFGPSTGFKLPDGSTRAADTAWVSNEQVERLSPKAQELCPRRPRIRRGVALRYRPACPLERKNDQDLDRQRRAPCLVD